MSEIYDTTTDRLGLLAERLDSNRRYYGVEDPVNKTLGVFAEAALVALDQPYFRELVEDMFDMRPDLDITQAVKLLERGYQADLLQHDPAYPLGYQDVSAWLEAFAAIDEDELRWGVLRNNICSQRVQSNVADRYKSVKLLAALTEERFGDPPSHLDIGSSEGHGNIKLVYNRIEPTPRVPFGEIEVVKHEQRATLKRDDYMTMLANTALKQHVRFGAAMGVDITDVDDPVIKQWVKSCSFYPDELRDEARVSEYEELDRLDPHHQRVLAFRDDFANFDFKRFRDVSPVETYDFITFSTIFYQVSKQEQLAMLVNASQLVSENGLIVIQDAPDGNFAKKYNYQTSVIDAMLRYPVEQHLLTWENGRCQKAILGMGRFSVRGKLRTVTQALRERYPDGNA